MSLHVTLALMSLATAPTAAPAPAIADSACPVLMPDKVPVKGRQSPLDSLSFTAAGKTVKLCYGRPSARGRKMIGGENVPYGKLWRTGANEPTTLHADGTFHVEGLELESGSYSLYSVPGPESWKFVVNRSIRQWGLESEYTAEVAAQEVGRFEVPAEKLAQPVESLTFRVEEEPEGLSGVADVYLEWQTSRVRIRFVG